MSVVVALVELKLDATMHIMCSIEWELRLAGLFKNIVPVCEIRNSPPSADCDTDYGTYLR